MEKKKRYEAYYAGYTYKKPLTYWTPVREAASRLTRVDPSQPGPIAAGGMPVLSDGGNIFLDDKDGHTAVIAASGMKKSICCFMPLIVSLGRAGENMVVTDPKGELYQRTSGFLENLGYRVLCLDFRAMDKDRFNILRYPASVYRDGDHDKGLSLLSDITNALMEDQKEGRQDPFWANTAVQWLNGTGALMLDAYPDIRKINVLNWSDFNTKEMAELVMHNVVMHMPESTVTALLRQVYSSADKTLRSVLVTASSALGMFNQNPRLAAMLSDNTFCLEDLTEPKTALYLVTDDTTSTVDPILGILISQIQSFLVAQAFGSGNGKLETRMNFVLDEFGSIPVPNMDKALATHRSRNIRYYLCIQSLAQMRRRYPEPEALLANCASTLYSGNQQPPLCRPRGSHREKIQPNRRRLRPRLLSRRRDIDRVWSDGLCV